MFNLTGKKFSQPSVGAATALLMATLLTPIRAAVSAESIPMTNLSSECALAVSAAVRDLEKWYAAQEKRSASTFTAYFREKYGEITCESAEGKLRVYFYPSEPGTRGGGIDYVVSADGSEVISRTFDR